MNSTSGTLNLNMRPPVSEAIGQVVEELWQKGYDLKKAGMGWVVREPLGASKIELASDHELLEFVGGGYKLAIHRPESHMGTESYHVTPINAASIAASPHPVRQASPRLSAPPLPVAASSESLSLKQLMLDTWQEFVPTRFRYWIAFALAIPFVLILAAESWRWYEQWMLATPNDAKAVAQVTPVGLPPVPLEGSPDDRAPVESKPAVTMLSNATRFNDQPQPAVLLSVLPVKANKLANPQDLTLFADQCAIQLKERFSSGPLVLMVNAQARRATVCYVVDGNTHCPYVSQGRATLNYLDVESNPPNVYACDIDVNTNAVGNLRLIEANPDIVRFLTTHGAS